MALENHSQDFDSVRSSNGRIDRGVLEPAAKPPQGGSLSPASAGSRGAEGGPEQPARPSHSFPNPAALRAWRLRLPDRRRRLAFAALGRSDPLIARLASEQRRDDTHVIFPERRLSGPRGMFARRSNESEFVAPVVADAPHGSGYSVLSLPVTVSAKAAARGKFIRALGLLPRSPVGLRASLSPGRHTREQCEMRDLLAVVIAETRPSPTEAIEILGCSSRTTIYNLERRGMELLQELRASDARIEGKLDDLYRLLLDLNGANPADEAEMILSTDED
jgi:hypothetical protein